MRNSLARAMLSAAAAVVVTGAFRPPAFAQDADGTSSAQVCGSNPESDLREIFGKVAQYASLQWNGNQGYDQATSKPVLLSYNTNRFGDFSCQSNQPVAGASIATTAECDNFWVITLAMGICEAAHSKDEAAFVMAHELSHLVLRHAQKVADFKTQLYTQWSASDGQADFAAIRDEENAKAQQRIQAEHPELAQTHDPAQYAAIVNPYKQAADQEAANRLWARFLEVKKADIDAARRPNETEADQNGLNLVGQAGFDRNQAANMVGHAAELKQAVDFEPDTRHPPPAVRQLVLQQLASEFGP